MSANEKATAKMAPFQLEEMLARVGSAASERETVVPSHRPSRFASIALALAASTSGVLVCALIFNR